MKEIPVLFYDKRECCGCSACYSICPVNAIEMLPDEEGFLYPVIVEKLCIRCKKCVMVCSFKHEQDKHAMLNGRKEGRSL